MRILSFDIGIKNLAYCLIDAHEDGAFSIVAWDVLSLCGAEPRCTCTVVRKRKSVVCDKAAKYRRGDALYCRTCAKKCEFCVPTAAHKALDRKRSTVAELKALAVDMAVSAPLPASKDALAAMLREHRDNTVLSPVVRDSASSLDLVTAGIALRACLDAVPEMMTADTVVIENQISTLASRMKTIQGMLAQYFIMRDCTDVKFVSAAMKLKPFIKGRRTKYNERKRLAVTACLDILQRANMKTQLQSVVHHRKKDDLADAFLQGIVYLMEADVIKVAHGEIG